MSTERVQAISQAVQKQQKDSDVRLSRASGIYKVNERSRYITGGTGWCLSWEMKDKECVPTEAKPAQGPRLAFSHIRRNNLTKIHQKPFESFLWSHKIIKRGVALSVHLTKLKVIVKVENYFFGLAANFLVNCR